MIELVSDDVIVVEVVGEVVSVVLEVGVVVGLVVCEVVTVVVVVALVVRLVVGVVNSHPANVPSRNESTALFNKAAATSHPAKSVADTMFPPPSHSSLLSTS